MTTVKITEDWAIDLSEVQAMDRGRDDVISFAFRGTDVVLGQNFGCKSVDHADAVYELLVDAYLGDQDTIEALKRTSAVELAQKRMRGTK